MEKRIDVLKNGVRCIKKWDLIDAPNEDRRTWKEEARSSSLCDVCRSLDCSFLFGVAAVSL
jgi:hypothetical protein